MTYNCEIVDKYKKLNLLIKNGGTVFFGADWLYNIPLSEIAESYGADMPIYNRSVKGLKMKDCEKVIDTCVCDINPDKVFINIGENDVTDENFNAGEFFDKYEWLLYTIHSKCKCDIYILSVVTDKNTRVNSRLEELAKKHGCEYIDIQCCGQPVLNFFPKMRFFLRREPITFSEAMSM